MIRELSRQLTGNRLLRAGGIVFFLRMAAILASVICSVVLARVLGPEDFGTYVFAFTILAFLAMPVQMGLPTLIVRETVRAQASEDYPLMLGAWRWANRYTLFSFIVIALAVAAVLWLFPTILENNWAGSMLIGLPLVVLIAYGKVRGGIINGLRVYRRIPEDVIRLSTLAVLAGTAYWLLDKPVTPGTAMGMHVVAATITLGVGIWQLRRVRPPEISTVTTVKEHSAQWRSALLPLSFVSGMQLISQQTDILILGMWHPSDQVGLYKVAASAATLAVFGLKIVNIVVEPQFARLYQSGEREKLESLAAASAAVSFVMTVPVVLIFLFWGETLLGLLYGESYAGSLVPLLILLAGQSVNAFFGSSISLLNMSGYEKETLRGLVYSTSINVVLNLMLVPSYGMSGAAWATAISVVVFNLWFWRILNRRIGIDTSALAIRKIRLSR